MLYYEKKAKTKGFSFVIGIDEAGRGPLAGPVVAAAVQCRSSRFRNRIADSKMLTPRQREKSFLEINEKAAVGVGIMNEGVVDSMNIVGATRLAMEQAVENLFYRLRKNVRKKNVILLIDGTVPLTLPYNSKNIIKGDTRSLSIASASIVAKVVRDRIMDAYHQVYPHYYFNKHKGYGTKRHFRAIRKHGSCLIHRKSFYPCKEKSKRVHP